MFVTGLWDRLCRQAELAVETDKPLVFEGYDRIYVQNALAMAWSFAESGYDRDPSARAAKLLSQMELERAKT
jgi:hypothetical protein